MKSIAQQALAEVIGTFALVFIGAGSVVVLGGRGLDPAGLIGIALAHGLVLAVMVSNLGHISGAHFNPAVTAGAWIVGKIESVRAAVYVVAQAAGAVAGAAVLRLVIPAQIWPGTNLGLPAVNHTAGINTGKAIIIEGVLTFFLVLTVFATAIDDRGVFRSIAGLSIGLVLTFDIIVGGFLTGASMNPARTFGPALVSGTWTDFWIYLVGPLSGSILAAALYWFVYLRDRDVRLPRTETPIGGGPEEDLGVAGVADVIGDPVDEDEPVDEFDDGGLGDDASTVDSAGEPAAEADEPSASARDTSVATDEAT